MLLAIGVGDQDRQMIRDSRGEKGVETEAEGQTNKQKPRPQGFLAAGPLAPLSGSAATVLGFPRLSGGPWQRAVTASERWRPQARPTALHC